MFSSFSDIITLIFLGFAFVYPFFLWITPLRTIDNGFYRFNLGMCCIVGAIGGTTFHFLNPDIVSEIYLWVWFGAIMFITAIYWNSNHINNIVITSIAIFGIVTMFQVVNNLTPDFFSYSVWFIVLLGSAITAAVFFAMILGHWYLNVVALPIKLLKKATLVMWVLLFIRTIWDVFFISIDSFVDSFGISHRLWVYMLQFDGFLLLVAFFMGNIVPIVLNIFIWNTLKLQATQSATGLLYISVLSILFGDLLYKYYLLQYGFLL